MPEKKILTIFAALKARPRLVAARMVLFAALCGFIASCWLYWSVEGGVRESSPRPLSLSAQAEGMRMSAEVLAAVLSKEAERTAPDGSKADDAALAATLNRVYPDLAESGYFVLWRGTVDVCSPLTPDTAGRDFGQECDASGAYFVRELEEAARKGGGFHSFTLSYDAPPGDGKTSSQGFKSEFIAYAVPVTGTDLHLTLWRPVDQAAFSLQAELGDDSGNWSLLGLCMSGLSFLGVSVLLRGFKD